MTRYLLLIPTTSCQASCSYCFGPRFGQPVMGGNVVDGVARWLEAWPREEASRVIFHGGEPLLAGMRWYRENLPRLRHSREQGVSLSAQSNLWALDEDFCGLFKEFDVSLGTSLDGPEEINDAQRGKGYFRRTMAGIDLARKAGLKLCCIVTFTALSLPRWREVVEFFKHEGLVFSIHAALPGLSASPGQSFQWAVSSAEYGEFLVELLQMYLGYLDDMRITTLDAMCRSVTAGMGGVCAFGDCRGHYLAGGPDGGISPCPRFVGVDNFRLGSVLEVDSIHRSAGWRRLAERQERIREDCADCDFLDICLGGCPYDALSAGMLRDPLCGSYLRLFGEVVNRGVEAVLADENLGLMGEDRQGQGGMVRLLRGQR